MSQSPKHEPASDTRPAMSEAEVAECDGICKRMTVNIQCVAAVVHMHVQIEEDPSKGAPAPFLSRYEIFRSLDGLMRDIASDRDRLATLFGAK
jgi:hypothetical protein